MTQDTKIILHELAIIHATLKVIMEQQEEIAGNILEPDKASKTPPQIRIAEAAALMKQRLMKEFGLEQADF